MRGAHLASLGRDQAAGEPVSEELLVAGRAAFGSREGPPALVLVLREPPLLAAREQQQQPVGEVELLLDGDADVGGVRKQGAKGKVEVAQRRGKVSRRDDLRASVTSDLHLAGRNQVSEHAVPPSLDRDPPHGVGQVAVEAREESKAVLAGKVPPAARSRARHRNAARLAARDRPGLVDRYVEVTLRELVGGTHAADATAEDDHSIAHERRRIAGYRPRMRPTVSSAARRTSSAFSGGR